MKLYNANLSPNCLRVRAVAHELGVELDVVDVNVFDEGPAKDELRSLNANAKVPVLVDGDFVLWESRAINRYLAARHPERGLYPSDPRTRALIDQWSFWQAIHLGPAMQTVSFERVVKGRFGMGAPDEALVEAKLRETTRYLDVLDDGLADREWLVGDLSLADFAVATTFVIRDDAGISLAGLPRVAAWIERLEARESWRRAVAPMLAGVSQTP